MSVNTGFLPRTVTILVECSTAFLGSTGDDGGDLAGWFGLDQIIGDFDKLGDPIIIVVKSDAGGSEYLTMSTSRIVSELDGEELVAFLVSVFAICGVLNVAEELV